MSCAQRNFSAAILATLVCLLSGCADTGSGNGTGATRESTAGQQGSADGGKVGELQAVSSCAEISPLLTGYLEGLTLTADSEAQQDYFSCEWTIPDPDSLEQIRSVIVTGDRGERTAPDADILERSGMAVTRDPRLEALGAVAWGTDVLNPVAGVQVTIIATGQAEIQISGSRFAALPDLGGAAAVEVALALLH